jgi:hypothetical protein
MKSIGDILPSLQKKVDEAPKGRKRLTERGELMRFFLRHINYGRKQDGLPPMTMAHMGVTLEQIPTQDLYYLKSVCSKAIGSDEASTEIKHPRLRRGFTTLPLNMA